MSTPTIFYFAIGVFTLMMIGIVLTALEFRKLSAKSAARKRAEGRDS
jgi:hypothetical protein